MQRPLGCWLRFGSCCDYYWIDSCLRRFHEGWRPIWLKIFALGGQGMGMKAGWHTKPLAALCEVFGDGDWIESKDQSADGIRLIQTGNVGEGVFKDRGEKARYISEETFKRLRCTEIFEGDCLISRLPDPAGRSCILPDTGERMITAVDCTIVRFNVNQTLPRLCCTNLPTIAGRLAG